MRVLAVNKFWYSRGGAEQMMFNEIAWLEDAGHEVAHFSAAHPLNRPSRWSRYFAPYLELGPGGDLRTTQKALAAARMFCNREAARRFTALLRDFRPDVVHFHGIHRQLSPSVMIAARRHDVAAVQTFHDHQAACPADVLLRAGREPCLPPLCNRLDPLPCVRHRCMRGSAAASVLTAAEFVWSYDVLHCESLVDVAIAPSRYLSRVLTEHGWRHTPLRVLPNATPPSARGGGGDHFVYAGRLSVEKGVAVLLSATESARTRVVIAGEGPLLAPLQASAASHRACVTFAGRVEPRDVGRLISTSRAVVVPSLCVENAPLTVLEAMASGRPVIATRVGGIPEQVRDGLDGLLVAPGDADGLAVALRRLSDDASLAHAMGESGRARVREVFSPESHTQGLLEVYGEAVDRSTRRGHATIAPRRPRRRHHQRKGAPQ